jgi:uncharacterized membrane-anchored protein YjiN (DUF445 family)
VPLSYKPLAPEIRSMTTPISVINTPIPQELEDETSPHPKHRPALARRETVWWIATGALFILAIVYALTSYFFTREIVALQILRAFSEAAMVGALADWFAVTALFKRPLGLPIPHTGIIPANKNRIGKSLGLFVQRNFLTEEVLEGQSFNISAGAARFLRSESNRARVIERARVLVPRLIEVLNDPEVQRFLNLQVEEVVRRSDLARGLSKLLRSLTANQLHELLLDEVITQLHGLFKANQLWFRYQLREATPWFVPEFIDRKIFDAIAVKTEATLSEALKNRNHELRQRLLSAVYTFIVRLESSDEVRQKGEELKRVILESGVFRGYISALRDTLLSGIEGDVRQRESLLLKALERFLSNGADALLESTSLQRKLDRFTRGILSALVGRDSTFVADLISKTISGWDSKTLVAKLEEEVGADLQYIRINGTLVGGLVGVLLWVIGFLVGER